MKHCEFCDEFSGGAQNEFAKRYAGHISNRSLFGNSHFQIVPTLGQIVEGHLLVVPTEHRCALADVPNQELRELETLCRRISSILTEKHGSCVFFEHGTRGERSGGCGIDHAHMHAVPVAAVGVLDVLTREFGGFAITDLADINEVVKRESSYLFFEDGSASRHVFPVKELPSQYMRKLVSESIGKSDWDWRKCGREPELLSTLERLTPLFSPAAFVAQE